MKNKDVVLSVIVPVYNMGKYLGTCLDSILAQEIPDMEILVVDAGSTDNTRKLIQAYSKKYSEIKPIYSDKQLWASAARNLALDRAKGKYLAFCDADDMIPKGAYQKLLDSAEENRSDIVVGNYTHKYLDGIRNPVIYLNEDPFGRCLEKCNISFCNKMMRKDFVGAIRFAEDLRTAEDGLFMLELYQKNPKTSYLDEIVYIYTLEKDSEDETDSHDKRNYCFNALHDSMEVLRRIFGNKLSDHEKEWARFYVDYLGFAFNGIWRNIIDPEEREQGFNCIKDTIKYLKEANSECNFAINNLHDNFAYSFGMSYSDFFTLSFESYVIATTKSGSGSINVSEAFIYGCSIGTIGMKPIIAAAKGWAKHKLRH